MYPANDTVATLTPGRTQVRARARLLERLATMASAVRAPDSSPRQAADAWQHPARRFWRRRLGGEPHQKTAALVAPGHDYERTSRTLGALVKLTAALPDAERRPPAAEETRQLAPEQQVALLPHLAAYLYVAAAGDASAYGNGARLRRAACELLLLGSGAPSAFELAHQHDSGAVWSELARTRSRLVRERAARASGYPPPRVHR